MSRAMSRAHGCRREGESKVMMATVLWDEVKWVPVVL